LATVKNYSLLIFCFIFFVLFLFAFLCLFFAYQNLYTPMKYTLICLVAFLALSHSSIKAQPKTNPGGKTPTVKVDNKNDKKKVTFSDSVQVKIRQGTNPIYMGMDSAYQKRIQLAKIDDIYIPRDLYDCFRELDKSMEPDVKKNFMAFTDEEVDRRTHASLGKWIDHKWSLTDGSRLSAYFTKMKVPHPDYMVGIIITSYHRHLHKKDLKVQEQVERFRKIWQKKQKEEAAKMLNKK
jgi:hypothetical protein